jgi:[ribosomal protein S5]-alanine N-acetyltransferase
MQIAPAMTILRSGTGKVSMRPPQSAGGISVDITTERFRIRTLTPADASQRFLAWIADADVMGPLNMPARQLTSAEIVAYVGTFDRKRRHLLGLFDKTSAAHIGIVIVEISEQHRLAKIAYLIGDKAYRGKGAMRECLAAVIGHAFTRLGIEKITAHVETVNSASINVLEALGLRREGTMRGEIRSFAMVRGSTSISTAYSSRTGPAAPASLRSDS